MLCRATTRRLSAAIATFAMLLAALAPTITSALAAANDQHVQWTVVCSADGARLVPVPTDAQGVPVAPKAHHIDHCPFCASHAAFAAAPPPAHVEAPLVAGSEPVPVLSLLAPRPLFAWATAQPRAPPSAS
jgi:Protein of unknown function (DUF2946)